MEIKVLSLGELSVNCYLLSTEKAAVIIDPGYKSVQIDSFLEENKSKECLCLLTHGHFDHIGAVSHLKEKYGIKVAIGELDAPALSDDFLNLSGNFTNSLEPTSADVLIKDGETFSVGDITFKAIHTPGHTVGSMCYLVDDVLFSGDTLFRLSIGRTDFPGGDFNTIINSINKLFTLPDTTPVFSGHGEKTTIGAEKQYNPFLRW